MYVHLGQDYIVPLRAIIGLFDMDKALSSKHTRAFFARMEAEGRVVSAFEDLPRAAVLCETALGERLYLSQLSTAALSQRVGRAAACDFT